MVYKRTEKYNTTLEIVFGIVSMPFSYWEYTFLQKELDYVQHFLKFYSSFKVC